MTDAQNSEGASAGHASRRRTVAVIPARGGSKGVPGKNIKPLAGKPLIAYTIEAAARAETVGRVIVSTDDPKIGEVAHQFGAEVVWRPAELAGDRASSESALIHVVDQLKAFGGVLPELLVFLQCTSPLTTPHDVDGTVRALTASGADTALAVAKFHSFVWREANDGSVVGVNHDKNVRLMRQQREAEYLETGAVYVMRVNGLLEHRHRFFGKTAMHVVPRDRVLEIDDPEDFLIAEARMGQLRTRDGAMDNQDIE